MQEKISVIHEDKNFVAVYKPAGILVHSTKIPAGLYSATKFVSSWITEIFSCI